MTSLNRAERLAELVKSAVECGPNHWDAFLDGECGSDPAMRVEIDSLLKHQEHATQFIETPALHLAAESFVREGADRAGQTIGDYEILSLIGSGGMGEVYLAQDRQLHRKAALKLIRRGMDSEDIVRHFKHEERLLASLNHPNIAQLYGSGVTPDEIPFFAMEYVEGERLDQYCDERRLATEERLQLFRKVCSAVTYAHQHLVIHRDIKPANIRVTAEGEPKLLDFGIAKLLDAEGGQNSGQILTLQGVMTPEYASPEQVRAETMTTASDVYSLGVVLYELLTGVRPYRISSRRPDEIARAITEQEPTRPSTAVAAAPPPPELPGEDRRRGRRRYELRGDLDNIVLMALRKEPARRYASVAQFSEDIRRHLEGLPVIARKDTLRYRSEKFVQRHKVAVAAAALIAVSLLGGIITTLWQANRATRQARVAAQERDRAQRRFDDVRQLANALLTQIAPKIERLQGATEARQSLLTQSLKYLDSLAKESAGDPVLQSELAAAYEKVGDLQGNPTNPNLMTLADALESYGKAHAIRQQLIAHDPRNTEQRRLLADNYRVLGDIRWQTNELAESLKNSEAALHLYTGLLAEDPRSTELGLAWSRSNHDIGRSYSGNERYAESIGYFQKAIEAAEELRRQSPDRAEVLMLLGACRREMANSLCWEGKQKEAEAEMEKALAAYEPLHGADPNDVSVRTGLYQTYMMTSSLYEEVNGPLATEYGLKALRIISQSVENDPADARAKQQLARTYSRLGATLDNEGKNAESILYLEKAAAILQEITRKETKNRWFTHDLATVFIRLGNSRHKQREFSSALKDFDKAAAILLELAKTDEANNASRRNLANVYGSAAKAHEELAAASTGAEAQSHRQKAQQFVRWTLDALRQLQARNALSNYDRKALEELEAAAEKRPGE